MEKSFACDPPGIRRVIKAGEAAENKNVKIAAGLMCRHSKNRQELIHRIRDNALGQIQLMRAYRMEPEAPLGPRPQNEDELHWQIRNFVRFCGCRAVSGPKWTSIRSTSSAGSKTHGPFQRMELVVGPPTAPTAARISTPSRSRGRFPTAQRLTM